MQLLPTLTTAHALFLDFDGTLTELAPRPEAIRKPERFAEILLACECDARGRLGFEESAYPQRPRLLAVLAAVQSVVTREIAAQAAARGQSGAQVGALIHKARVEAVAQWLSAPTAR